MSYMSIARNHTSQGDAFILLTVRDVWLQMFRTEHQVRFPSCHNETKKSEKQATVIVIILLISYFYYDFQFFRIIYPPLHIISVLIYICRSFLYFFPSLSS